MTPPVWTTNKADTRAEIGKVGILTIQYKATTDSYCVAVFGIRLPGRYPTQDDAKAGAIGEARKRLSNGLTTLADLARP